MDDSYESDDLDADMTVADVFVDNGQARADGRDQRGTVRVIQKPAPYAPVRFPSVTQDWDAAADEFERQSRTKKQAVDKFPTIHEEPQRTPDSDPYSYRWRASSVNHQSNSNQDTLPSTEREEIPGSPQEWAGKSLLDEPEPAHRGSTVTATPQQKRMQSQELGDWPSSASISRHQGQQSNSIPRSTENHALANEQPLSSAEESSDDQKSESTPTPQKVSSHTGHLPESAQAAETFQERPTIQDDDEQDGVQDPQFDERGPSHSQSGQDNRAQGMDQAEEHRADDHDITMTGSTPNGNQDPAPSSRTDAEDPASNEPADAEGPLFASKLGKRKKSPDHLEPNKEPRLGHFDSRPTSSQEAHRERADPKPLGTPTTSPRKRERGPSFSAAARRLSFSGEPELPQQGLGLGITKSPSKQPVASDLSQESGQASRQVLGEGVPSSSAPIPRWGSAFQNHSTPKHRSALSPAADANQLHSALRKGSPSERSSERRSVSFVDNDISITNVRSTPKPAAKDTSTPANHSSDKRRSSAGSMVYPPNVSKEEIARIQREAEEKYSREKSELEQLRGKLKAAEKENPRSPYRQKLSEACQTFELMQDKKAGATKTKAKQRAKYEKLRREIAEIEASSIPSFSQPKQDRKEPKTSNHQKTSKNTSQESRQSKAVDGADKTPSSEITIKSRKSPHTAPQPQSRAADSAPKAATSASSVEPRQPQANRPVAKGTKASREVGDPDLPSMKAVHRSGTAIKSPATTAGRSDQEPASQKTAIVSSSESESESESEESDSEESDSEESGSEESGSEESDSWGRAPPNKGASIKPGSIAPAKTRTNASASPSQAALSQPWSRQPSSSQTRPTLKSLKSDQKKEQQEKSQPQQSNARRRGPNTLDESSDSDDDNSESDESESESESEADDGDIQSSGQRAKLSASKRR